MKKKLKTVLQLTKNKGVSLFWKYVLLMGILLLVAGIVLAVNNRRSQAVLETELVNKMRGELTQNCKDLNQMMYGTIQIPTIIEESRYYSYISEDYGSLDLKHYPMLSYIRGILQEQVYLTTGARETLVYLRRSNSIVSTKRYEPVAEDYVRKNLSFSDLGEEELLALLRKKNHCLLLPMQMVEINGEAPGECLAVVIHPMGTRISVMSLYSREVLLERLGIDKLPQGTGWALRDSEGRLLAASGEAEAQGFLLEGELEAFRVTVEVSVPRSYFEELLRQNRSRNMLAMAAMLAAGLTLAIVFSGILVNPLRKLVAAHGGKGDSWKGNELLYLRELLSTSREDQLIMYRRLRRQLLGMAFCGGVLQEADEGLLEKEIPCLQSGFRVAILHTSPRFNAAIGQRLDEALPGMAWTAFHDRETGVVFANRDSELRLLTGVVNELNALAEDGVSCGISQPVSSIRELSAGIRQARLSIPAEAGCVCYRGSSAPAGADSWQQCQRLYQQIIGSDVEGANRLFDSIAARVDRTSARELFYALQLVLNAALQEMGHTPPEEQPGEYLPNLSPGENLERLKQELGRVFARNETRKRDEADRRTREILEWIGRQLSETELNARTVAEQFGMTENGIYELTRAATGMSFKEYLTELRMKQAKALLCATGKDMAEIARICGYESSSTFYRLFKKRFGMPPGEYRKQQ